MREEWNYWFEHGPIEYTPKGYSKRPSYEWLLKMVSNALKKITPDMIRRSFEACGIKANGGKVNVESLNGRLRGILGYQEGLEEIEGIQQQDEMSEDSDGQDEAAPDVEVDFLS